MATRFIVFPPAAPGTTPTPIITEVPDLDTTPVQPGVTFNGSPEAFADFLRSMGVLATPAAPAPLTGSQRFVRLLERTSWWISDLIGGVFRTLGLGVALVLAYLLAAYNGYAPMPNWDFLAEVVGIEQQEAPPAPRPSGPSTADKLDALGTQIGELQGSIGGIQTKVGEIEGELQQKAAELPPVVEQPVKKPPFWKRQPKANATP